MFTGVVIFEDVTVIDGETYRDPFPMVKVTTGQRTWAKAHDAARALAVKTLDEAVERLASGGHADERHTVKTAADTLRVGPISRATYEFKPNGSGRYSTYLVRLAVTEGRR